MTLLKVEDLAMGFGDAPDVLRDASVTVEAGEFVTVIGPSGCGKSTIMNAVAGLLPPRAGRVLFRGEPVTEINTEVGYMTQGDTLLPWRTVSDNIGMPLLLRKVPKRELSTRVSEMLELMDLTEAADKYPSQLSGGMKRRALLGRSMIYRPDLLLMDEPFAALDAQLRTQLHAELRRSVSITHQAVLFITHDINEAVLLSDRVVVLGGKPATATAEIDIPFGQDRDVTNLRFSDDFVRLEREIHGHLQDARGSS